MSRQHSIDLLSEELQLQSGQKNKFKCWNRRTRIVCNHRDQNDDCLKMDSRLNCGRMELHVGGLDPGLKMGIEGLSESHSATKCTSWLVWQNGVWLCSLVRPNSTSWRHPPSTLTSASYSYSCLLLHNCRRHTFRPLWTLMRPSSALPGFGPL